MSAEVLANLIGTKKTFKTVKIPELADVNAQAVQQQTIAGNIAAAPGATQLAGYINKFNFDELQKMVREATPYYDEIMQTGGRQLSSMLRGEVPEDVQRVVQRSRGAKSFAGGYGGSGMAGAAEAEDLGLTSLGIIREGLSASERWLQSVRLPQLADVSGMFLSPQRAVDRAYDERNNRWNFNFLKAQQANMPKGWEIAVTGLTDWLENIGASAATMGISGAMGGGGMGGGLTAQDTTPATRDAGWGRGNMWDYYPTGAA